MFRGIHISFRKNVVKNLILSHKLLEECSLKEKSLIQKKSSLENIGDKSLGRNQSYTGFHKLRA